MTQYILTSPCTAELVEKNSRFIGWGFPCSTLKDFNSLHNKMKSEYQDASHVAYAYLIVEDGTQKIRFSDDGEPGGTAGKPILNHLQGKGLINAVIFVIRYFGGVKLGAGGLVRAYGGGAREALAVANIEEYIPVSQLEFTASYDTQKHIEYCLK